MDQDTVITDLIIELKTFLDAIREDSRISPVHISLFTAILQQWDENKCRNPIIISPGDLMQLSKISGRATYYKSLKELSKYGYIYYEPSHKRVPGSLIYLKSKMI